MLLLYVSLLSLDPKKATQEVIEVMNATSCPPDACSIIQQLVRLRSVGPILMTMPGPSPSTCASASDLGRAADRFSNLKIRRYPKQKENMHRCTLQFSQFMIFIASHCIAAHCMKVTETSELKILEAFIDKKNSEILSRFEDLLQHQRSCHQHLGFSLV